jgi:hydroxyethylthiazole kinase
MITASTLWEELERIRAVSPLIHNITNYVVMNTTANALLAIGASPVMAHAIEEVEEMTALSKALVLNIGTLSASWVDSMVHAGQEARRRQIPIILDPVGCGATSFRTAVAQRLLHEAPPTIVRGNASEIRALVFAEQSTKGVDSTQTSEASLEAAQLLAHKSQCVVSVSGPTDLIVTESGLLRILNGHPMMPSVTGLGCTASAITGAFAAVGSSPSAAAAHAMAVMGIAGEMAGERCAAPGSFQTHFLDALYLMTEEDILRRLKLA